MAASRQLFYCSRLPELAGWSPSLPIMVRGTRVDPFPADGQRQLQGSQYGAVDSFDQESWQRARTGAVRA